MTPDDWRRVPIPCSPGYNNCAVDEGPHFVLTYNDVDDRISITALDSNNAAIPNFFDDLDQINYEGSNGNGAITSGSFVTFGESVTVYDISTLVNAPTDLTQLDFFTVVPVLLGTWTGLQTINAVNTATYPLLTGIYSPAANQVAFVGERFLTGTAGAPSGGYLRMVSYSTGCWEGGDLYFDLDPITGDNDFTVIEHTDTLIVLENPRFSSCTPNDAEPFFTVNGMSLDAPGPNGGYGTPPGDGYYFYEPWLDTYSAVIDGGTPPPSSMTAVYVTAPDVIGLTAADPVMGDADSVELVTTAGTVTAGPGQFINPNSTTIAINGGAILVDAPTEITQINVLDAFSAVIATWSGSIDVEVADLTVTYDDIEDDLVIVSSFPALGSVDQVQMSTDTAGPGYIFGGSISYNDSEIRLLDFAVTYGGTFALPATITQLRLYNINGQQMKPVWNGALVIPAP